MARTVFKIAEVVARRLVGSIPTRSRQVKTLTPLTFFRLYFTEVYGEPRLSLHRLVRIRPGNRAERPTQHSASGRSSDHLFHKGPPSS